MPKNGGKSNEAQQHVGTLKSLLNEALAGLKAGVSRVILRSQPYYAKASKGSTSAIHYRD